MYTSRITEGKKITTFHVCFSPTKAEERRPTAVTDEAFMIAGTD